MLHIGCHLSVADGYAAMGQTALEIGADTFQFFSRNPRGGAVKRPSPADLQGLLAILKKQKFAPILAHAPYTYNPCAEKESLRDFARTAMREDLDALASIPGVLYNFHPGSHTGRGTLEGIRLIVETLNAVLTKETRPIVLLETMAGKGSEVGGAFVEIRRIIEQAAFPEKLGVCLDTCHVYSAGYDIVNDLDGVLDHFDKVIGLKRLKAIHLNDSMTPFGSHKDRHACIGQGTIGWEAIVRVINHPKLRRLPFYLETPNDLDGYADEIRRLRAASSK